MEISDTETAVTVVTKKTAVRILKGQKYTCA